MYMERIQVLPTETDGQDGNVITGNIYKSAVIKLNYDNISILVFAYL